jgi:hypothetical protein
MAAGTHVMDIVDFLNRHGLHTTLSKQGEIALCFTVESNSDDDQLNLDIFLDDQLVQQVTAVREPRRIKLSIPDDPAQHLLRMVMSGKSWQHTQQDHQGHIINDAVITVGDMIIDDTDITNLFYKFGIYHHDFNGNAQVQYQVPWHGVMGCNGTVLFGFRTPYYDWLLETM